MSGDNNSGWRDLDADVAAILNNRKQREQDLHLTATQRQERDRQAKRVRLVYDGPQWLKDEIQRVAKQEQQCSASSLGAFLLAVGLQEYHAGRIELERIPSKSPRFEFLIAPPTKNFSS